MQKGEPFEGENSSSPPFHPGLSFWKSDILFSVGPNPRPTRTISDVSDGVNFGYIQTRETPGKRALYVKLRNLRGKTPLPTNLARAGEYRCFYWHPSCARPRLEDMHEVSRCALTATPGSQPPSPMIHVGSGHHFGHPSSPLLHESPPPSQR